MCAKADRRIDDPLVAEAIRTKTAMVLGGGYPEERRNVAEATRKAVFERADKHCESCGRVLDLDGSSGDPNARATIQHVAGNSNELDNLQAFCSRCNTVDAQARFVPVKPGSVEAEFATALHFRFDATCPLRQCDQYEAWGSLWRALAAEAKEVIRGRQDRDGSAGDEDLPGFLGWTEQGTPIQEC